MKLIELKDETLINVEAIDLVRRIHDTGPDKVDGVSLAISGDLSVQVWGEEAENVLRILKEHAKGFFPTWMPY